MMLDPKFHFCSFCPLCRTLEPLPYSAIIMKENEAGFLFWMMCLNLDSKILFEKNNLKVGYMLAFSCKWLISSFWILRIPWSFTTWNLKRREYWQKVFISVFRLYWALVVALRLFSGCGQWGLLFVVVHTRLVAVASLVSEHGPQDAWASVVVAPWLSCCVACGIFPDQGSSPSPLHR